MNTRWKPVAAAALLGTTMVVAAQRPAAAFPLPYLSIYAQYGQSRAVAGLNFTPGTNWTLSAGRVTFSPSTVTASATGTISTTMSVPADLATKTFVVTATDLTGSLGNVLRTYAIEQPQITEITPEEALWNPVIEGRNFVPNEVVSVSTTNPTDPPFAVVADAGGAFHAGVGEHPLPPQKAVQTVTAVAGYGRQTVTTVIRPGTTLSVDQTLSNPRDPLLTDNHLASPQVGYYAVVEGCVLSLNQVHVGDLTNTLWRNFDDFVNRGSCTLTMQRDGDLVLINDSGRMVWSSGTGGTGVNNRLVLGQDGNLVIYTQSGSPVWSTRADGLLYSTTAYSASSRIGAAVYVNALVKVGNPAVGLARSPWRTAYVQRLINGTWQNMVARTTNAAGQFTVGFVQAAHVQYRILVLGTANASQAVSIATPLT